MRKTDRLLLQSTKEALLWLMRNYGHKIVLLLKLPGCGTNMEKRQGKSTGLDGATISIKNILRVWFYCLNMIRGNHIYMIFLF